MNTTTIQQATETRRRTLLIKSASYASVTVAISLVLAKAWAWQLTDSVALLASLADSVLDVVTSGITFWAVRYSLAPADSEHRFGHGKSEGVAALLQSLIVGVSAIYVFWEAMGRMADPAPIVRPEAGLLMMGVASVATIMLVSYQHYVARITGSLAIRADAMHYKADLLVNIGVAIAIVSAAWTGWQIVDPLVGLGVALYILKSAFHIARHSLDVLLDHEIPVDDRRHIEEIALAHPEARGFHDMRTRHGGSHYIVQFHLELDPEISLSRTHEILDEVEDEIRRQYPGCELIVHADPLGLPERRDIFD